MANIICLARMVSKQGKENELCNALSALLKPSRAEEGCLRYELARDTENDRLFTVIEMYRSKAAFEFHSQQSYLVTLKAQLATLADSVEITLSEVYSG